MRAVSWKSVGYAVILSSAAFASGLVHADESLAPADNPYGLDALWDQGDLVSRGTLLLLALMSVASWYMLVVKLVDQYRLRRQVRRARACFKETASLEAKTAKLAMDSVLRGLAQAGVDAIKSYQGRLSEKIDLQSWIALAVQRGVATIVEDMQSGLALLATVGSTAPFVGLFGTVWGIYHALTAIGIAGQASIDKVAGPVGEALIMTALGLATAVPAVLAYNWLVRGNKVIADSVRGFGAELHAALLASDAEDRR